MTAHVSMPSLRLVGGNGRRAKAALGKCIFLAALAVVIPSRLTFADAPATQPAPALSAAIDDPMFDHPRLPPQSNVVDFDAQDKPLWLAALARPDAETRRQAANAIGLAAAQGMPDLVDSAGALAATLDSDNRPIVRQSCAQALARLNAAPFAATLLKHDGDDWQTMLIADKALAAWNYGPARSAWRARLSDPQASPMALRSALQAIGNSADRSPEDIPPIQTIAIDPARESSLRLEAADVLARVATGGMLAPAAKLAGSHNMIDRLVAASMLGSIPDAQQVLLKLADDPEPMVVAVAARRLALIDPRLLADLDAKLADSDDFAVRKLAVEVFAGQRSDDSVGYLAKLLDDPFPAIRTEARDALLALSKDADVARAVSDAAAATVAGTDARGIEQALLLLGSIGDHRADSTIVHLLSNDSPKLRIAAVVAVRRLRIASALPALAARCAEIADKMKSALASARAGGPHLSEAEFAILGEEGTQIAQALGLMGYEPADSTLRQLISKEAGYAGNMRVAGIWALGQLHAGAPDEGLVGQLLGRATDHSMMMPEAQDVQVMSVETIGLMRATSAVQPLQHMIDTHDGADVLLDTCRWAIGQITGQPVAPPTVRHVVHHGYFLEAVH